MSPLSPQEFADKYFVVGSIFKQDVSDIDSFKDGAVPHYFVIMAKLDDEGYLLLATTQLQRKITYLEKCGRNLDTLVHIVNNIQNGLTEDSYFDCNDKYDTTLNKIIAKRRAGKIKYYGKLSREEYDKLVDGINLSDTIDIPKKLLNYP